MKDWSSFLELVLPPRTFEYFELSEAKVKEGKEKYMGLYGFDDTYTIILQEKDIIPEVIKQAAKGKRIRTKGYSEHGLSDFPIRGRKTVLVYRIRKWQIEGDRKIYQGKYEISQAGVNYTKDFSFFFDA
jgi:hypothetical protein